MPSAEVNKSRSLVTSYMLLGPIDGKETFLSMRKLTTRWSSPSQANGRRSSDHQNLFAKRCSAWNAPSNFPVLRGIYLACMDSSYDADELQVLHIEQSNRSSSFQFHLKLEWRRLHVHVRF